MQLIHTDEAKAFLDHSYSVGQSARPLLPVFLGKGTKLISSSRTPGDQRTIAAQFMSSIDVAHNRLLQLLRPFLFVNGDNLFKGLDPTPALDPQKHYSKLVMPAVNLLVDYDILLGLLDLYPSVHRDTPAVKAEATKQVQKAFSRIHAAEQRIASGKMFGKT